MNNDFKTYCICGAIAVTLVAATPICKKCLALQTPDLPSGNEPSSRADLYTLNKFGNGATGTAYISSVSTTTTTLYQRENK